MHRDRQSYLANMPPQSVLKGLLVKGFTTCGNQSKNLIDNARSYRWIRIEMATGTLKGHLLKFHIN